MIPINDDRRILCAQYIIQTDCGTIKTLLLKYQDPVFCMLIIPYIALFCRSVQEYNKTTLVGQDIDGEIYDIRNSLKIYSNKYGKAKKEILDSDEAQDDEFRNMLCFDFTKKYNMYNNLGIYFDEEKRIIGNTQLIADMLNLNGLSNIEKSKKAYLLGKELGSVVGRLSSEFPKAFATPQINLANNLPRLKYCDINTNNNTLFNKSFTKDVNLYILYLMSNLGFVRHYLKPLFLAENTWMFRIEYINMHYVYSGIQKLYLHLKSNPLNGSNELISTLYDLIESGKSLFNSRFRNCMMHYDLVENGMFIISDKYYSDNKMLYGLVEECFCGQKYELYVDALDNYAREVEECLASQFSFDKLSLKML